MMRAVLLIFASQLLILTEALFTSAFMAEAWSEILSNEKYCSFKVFKKKPV